jgi:hypothetical protein
VTAKKMPTPANGELEDLRELVEQGGEVAAEAAPAAAPSRRNLLKLAGAALAGAAGAAALRVVPAAASDGQAVLQGCLNLADSKTTLLTTGPGPLTQDGAAFIARSSTGLRGAGYYAADRNQSIGVLGISKNDISIFASNPDAPGPGTGVLGLVDQGIGVEGDSNTGVGGRFLSNTGYDVQLGALAGDSGIVGSGRLAMIGRGDVGGTAPNWDPNFYVHSSLGILNFQHEFVRGNDSSIWASTATQGATRSRWKRINTLRVDTADGLGNAYKPFRRLDTRTGARKAAGSITVLGIIGSGVGDSFIPYDARGVVGNLTAVGYTGGGFLVISPAGVTVGTSSLNFPTSGPAIANAFVCGLNSSGQLQIKVAGHSTHILLDITGYIQ